MIRALAIVLALAQAARAEEGACTRYTHLGLAEGPITLGFSDGDLGTGHRACPRNEFFAGARANAVIDTPGFYGSVATDGQLAISFRLPQAPRWEVSANLAAVHWQYVQNATLKSSEVGIGLLTLGAAVMALETRRFVLTPYARLLLPTASTSPHVVELGGELGLAAEFRPRAKVALHAYAGADVTGGISAAPADVRAGFDGDLGVQYSPATWFGAALDLQLRLGHRAALDSISPAIALRFRFRKTVGAELAALFPVAGADRQLVAFALKIHYRF